MILIIIIIAVVIIVLWKIIRSLRARQVLPPTAVTMSATTKAATNVEQSNTQPPHLQKTLSMPHAPLRGFSQHGYPLQVGYPLRQEAPLAYPQVAYPQLLDGYEYMSPGPYVPPPKY